MLNLIEIPSNIQWKSHEIRTKSHEIPIKTAVPGICQLLDGGGDRATLHLRPHGIHGMPFLVGFAVGYSLVI